MCFINEIWWCFFNFCISTFSIISICIYSFDINSKEILPITLFQEDNSNINCIIHSSTTINNIQESQIEWIYPKTLQASNETQVKTLLEISYNVILKEELKDLKLPKIYNDVVDNIRSSKTQNYSKDPCSLLLMHVKE